MKKIGIYIHFPFCAKKCNYCDFNSYSNKNELMQEYVRSLINEIRHYSSNFKDYLIDTIYIGGGTPSFCFDGGIATILDELKKNFNIESQAEISIESNPNSLTYQKCVEYKNCGINRVSVGLQTANKNILKKIGRIHTINDYKYAMKNLKKVGFVNVNTDLMIGLPSQHLTDLKRSLDISLKNGSKHISVYSLIVEDGTHLQTMLQKKECKLPKEEKVLSMYNYALKFLREKGFERYEVSNFSLHNYTCKHNVHTWQMQNYLGLGAGAHSFIDNIRWSNVSQIENYINEIKKSHTAIFQKEELTIEQLIEESIMLGLRMEKGLNFNFLKENYDYDLKNSKKIEIKQLVDMGLVSVNNNTIKATEEGFNVLNMIILKLV